MVFRLANDLGHPQGADPCAPAACWFPKRMLADIGSGDDLVARLDVPEWLLNEAIHMEAPVTAHC